MKFAVTINSHDDGVFVAECPAIRGCLEVRAEKGMPLTVTVHQVEISVEASE